MDTMNGMRRLAALTCLPVLAMVASACYMEVKDEEDKAPYSGQTRVDTGNAMPPALRGEAQTCEQRYDASTGGSNWQCYESPDYRWRTSCQSDACQEVKVFTHYMLADDLQGDYVVHVEAFDNEYFQGAPKASVRLANFAAKRGEWQDAQLFLDPGEYYLRAYMTSADDGATPYTLGGMTLVADQPVGVFGALSGAEMLRVAPKSQSAVTDPVHIYLDKLFKKPGSEPDSHAQLRVSLAVTGSAVIPDGRKVHVRLHKTNDLATAAVYDLTIASEALLVQGRVGRTEYVSPSLTPGHYVVFAYLDVDGNDLFDDGEPSATYKVDNLVTALDIQKDRIETIALPLTAPADDAPRE